MEDIKIKGDLEVDFDHKTIYAGSLKKRLIFAFKVFLKRPVINRIYGIILRKHIYKLTWKTPA